MNTKEREIVAAMIFSKDGKLFLGKKDPSKGGVYINCWHIPGGGIEAGETHADAFIREVKEEIGIDASGLDLKLVDDEGKGESEKIDKASGQTILVKMHFYVYQINLAQNAEDIPISLDDDLAEYQWVSLDELSTIQLTPPSVELFTKLGYL